MRKMTVTLTLSLLVFVLASCGSGSGDPILTDGDSDTDTIDTVDGDTEPALDGDTDTIDSDTADTDTIDSDTADGDLPDGDPDTTEEADTADSDSADPDQEIVCASNACAIGGICYTDGLADPASPCRKCDVAVTKTAWTNSSYGTTCNDGNSCTDSDQCDGQGTCKGTENTNCTADGDYDVDVDPDEVVIGAECPEENLSVCVGQSQIVCFSDKIWYFVRDCVDIGKACWKGACIVPSSAPDYPGCNLGDLACSHSEASGSFVAQCNQYQNWDATVPTCTSQGKACCLGECVDTASNLCQ